MPFLCSIPLNPLRRGAQRLLENPQRMHAAVEGVLPAVRSGRLLWRLEHAPHQANLLILAPDHPTVDHIIEQAGWPDAPGGAPRIADLKPLLDQLAAGREFEFRTRLNPTQNAATGDGGSVRRGHRTTAHQLRWFTDRTTGDASKWGFTVGSSPDESAVHVVARQQVSFHRAGGQRPVTLEAATFQGVLTVTDVASIRRSLLDGIGSGKAYGCGLLTLAPRRTHVVAR